MTTSTDHLISDRVVSWLRTVVPVLWGTVVTAILRTTTPHLPGDLGAALASWLGSEPTLALVTATVIGAWYALWRWAEPRLPDWVTRVVLGSAQTPIYVHDGEICALQHVQPEDRQPGAVPPSERGAHRAPEVRAGRRIRELGSPPARPRLDGARRDGPVVEPDVRRRALGRQQPRDSGR